jgi:hypothetical protein
MSDNSGLTGMFLDRYRGTKLVSDDKLMNMANQLVLAEVVGGADPRILPLLKEVIAARRAIAGLFFSHEPEAMADYMAQLIEATCDEDTQALFFKESR